MGLTAQLNETEWIECSIVLSLRRTAMRRSKMVDIIVSSNGLLHQEAVNTFSGLRSNLLLANEIVCLVLG